MATIKDIAKASGISYPTVSNVMTGKRPVSTKTKELVYATMRQLQYVPNGVARGLRRSRMNTLGLVLPYKMAAFLKDHCNGPISDSILVRALEIEQSVMINVAQNFPAGGEGVLTLCDGRIDGLLLIGQPTNGDLVKALKSRGFPFVCVTEAATGTDVPYVDADQMGLCSILVDHLYALGHRKFAVLSGEDRQVNVAQRLTGARSAFDRYGVAPENALVLPGLYTAQSGYDRVYRLLTCNPKTSQPTAIICLNDFIAHGALAAFEDLGVSCPDQVSVVGIDDTPAHDAVQHLTTVRLPLELIGINSVDVLHQIITGKSDLSLQQNLPGTLIVRGTSGPSPD